MTSPRLYLVVLSAAVMLAHVPCSLHAQDRAQRLLQQLADAPGPPGFENPVRAIMVGEMKPLATVPLRYDGMGSVIGQQGASGPRIMIDAHMDELGGMIRRVTPNGFLSMQMLGGWLDQALPDQRWIILGSKGPVHAVTGIRDVHVIPPNERNEVFSRNSIFLDVGAHNAAEVAALGLTQGDPVVPDSPFLVMNGTDNYLAKAWDDRVGLAVLVEAMRRTANHSHANQLFFVATTQEEVGLRGARAATEVVRPDIGIAIEGGVSGDVPGAHPEETQAHLGGGPGLFLFDTSAIANPKMVAFVRRIAAENHVPLQEDLVQGYGDDSAEMQTAAGGAPTVNIVVPVRYTHAHNGIMNRQDFDRTVDLVTDMLLALDQKTVDELRDWTPKQP